MMASSGALPNLIIVGAQKCGTTSLHNYLQVHPEIAMARIKETNFFLKDANWDRGLDWYASQFDSQAAVRGEGSPDYTNLPGSHGTAERMQQVIPGARIVYLVRDPLERIASHYVHFRAAGLERRAFEQAVAAPDNEYVARSCYATQLEPFLRCFGHERVLVETHERLLHDRLPTLQRIFRFVGVDDSFVSDDFERIWERTEGKGRGYSLAFRAAKRMRGRAGWLPQSMRWPVQRLLRSRLAGRPIERPTFDERLLALVRERLLGEVDELRRVSGLELEGWLR